MHSNVLEHHHIQRQIQAPFLHPQLLQLPSKVSWYEVCPTNSFCVLMYYLIRVFCRVSKFVSLMIRSDVVHLSRSVSICFFP